MKVATLSSRRLHLPTYYVSAAVLLSAFYVFTLAGGGGAFASLLSDSTQYGAGYGVWFGGLVVMVLAVAVAPVVGAWVGGLDYDLGTIKDLHLGGRRVFHLHLGTLAGAVVLELLLVLAGLLCALVVSSVAALGEYSWRGDPGLVSAGMVARLVLAGVVALPFATLTGWIFGVLLRSAFRGALIVEATLIIYIIGIHAVAGFSSSFDRIFRFSPWGALFALVVGNYEYPRIVLEPALGPTVCLFLIGGWSALFVLCAWMSSATRDIGGGGAS